MAFYNAFNPSTTEAEKVQPAQTLAALAQQQYATTNASTYYSTGTTTLGGIGIGPATGGGWQTLYPSWPLYPNQPLQTLGPIPTSPTTTQPINQEAAQSVEKWMKANVLQAKEVVESYLKFNIPVFLWGAPGIGKSDIVREIADDEQIGFIDLRCAQLDPVDLRGFPFVTDKQGGVGKIAAWAPPVFLPNEARDGKRGILFLDEMNLAPQAVLSAAYQLVLNRRVGEYVLPEGWRVVAAGNRQEDRSGVQALPKALANRFAHVDVVHDAAAWVQWAVRKQVHPVLIAYIRMRGNKHLHDMSGQDQRAFPTPRAWAQVSKVIRERGDRRKRMVAGLVGDVHAGEFLAFLDETANLPTLEEIVSDPEGAKMPDSPSRRHVVVTMLADGANKQNITAIMQYAGRLPREFEQLFMVDTLNRAPELKTHKSIEAWRTRTEKKKETEKPLDPQKGDFVRIEGSPQLGDGMYYVEDVATREEDGEKKRLLKLLVPHRRMPDKDRSSQEWGSRWFKLSDASVSRISMVEKPTGSKSDGWVLIGGSRWTDDGWYKFVAKDKMYVTARTDGKSLGELWVDNESIVGYADESTASVDAVYTKHD